MPDFSIGFAQFTTLEEDKRTERSPDVTGSIEVQATDVDALINYLQTAEREEDYKGDQVVKLRLAGWSSTIRNNVPMLKGKISEPYRPDSKPASAPVVTTGNVDIDF
jgi:hypothetical protein